MRKKAPHTSLFVDHDSQKTEMDIHSSCGAIQIQKQTYEEICRIKSKLQDSFSSSSEVDPSGYSILVCLPPNHFKQNLFCNRNKISNQCHFCVFLQLVHSRKLTASSFNQT